FFPIGGRLHALDRPFLHDVEVIGRVALAENVLAFSVVRFGDLAGDLAAIPFREEGKIGIFCSGSGFLIEASGHRIRLTVSTIARALIPKRFTSSSGFPLCGISRIAILCTRMPSLPTALRTASPSPPCA